MQIGAPSPVQVPHTRSPGDTALPAEIASSVPSVEPAAQATAELDATPFATAVLTPTTTITVTATPQPVAATPMPGVIIVPLTQLPQTNEQRWRAQEQDRKVNDPPRI